MNRIFLYLLLSFLTATNNSASTENNPIFAILVLGLIFILLVIGGYKLIRFQNGNYDVEYFTKLLGWAMTVLGIIGLYQCYIELVN